MYNIKINVGLEDEDRILNSIMEYVTLDFKNYLAEKSESPKQFYKELSNTVVEKDNKVYASGLTAYILNKRPWLPWDYVEDLSERLSAMNIRIT